MTFNYPCFPDPPEDPPEPTPGPACPNCGSGETILQQYPTRPKYIYDEFFCFDCGESWVVQRDTVDDDDIPF